MILIRAGKFCALAEMEKIARRCGVGEGGGAREAFAAHSLMSKVRGLGVVEGGMD